MLVRESERARRARSATQRVRLLIAEKGADNLDAYLSPAEYDELIVLRQLEGETPTDLFVRTLTRISSLECTGKRVCHAFIALAPSFEPELAAARQMLGLALLSHVNAVGDDSELVLGIAHSAALEFRQQIMSLVESLVAHPGSRHAPIRVVLRDQSRSPRGEARSE